MKSAKKLSEVASLLKHKLSLIEQLNSINQKLVNIACEDPELLDVISIHFQAEQKSIIRPDQKELSLN